MFHTEAGYVSHRNRYTFHTESVTHFTIKNSQKLHTKNFMISFTLTKCNKSQKLISWTMIKTNIWNDTKAHTHLLIFKIDYHPQEIKLFILWIPLRLCNMCAMQSFFKVNALYSLLCIIIFFTWTWSNRFQSYH